jgi:hypothetical protein
LSVVASAGGGGGGAGGRAGGATPPSRAGVDPADGARLSAFAPAAASAPPGVTIPIAASALSPTPPAPPLAPALPAPPTVPGAPGVVARAPASASRWASGSAPSGTVAPHAATASRAAGARRPTGKRFTRIDAVEAACIMGLLWGTRITVRGGDRTYVGPAARSVRVRLQSDVARSVDATGGVWECEPFYAARIDFMGSHVAPRTLAFEVARQVRRVERSPLRCAVRLPWRSLERPGSIRRPRWRRGGRRTDTSVRVARLRRRAVVEPSGDGRRTWRGRAERRPWRGWSRVGRSGWRWTWGLLVGGGRERD